MSYAAEGIKWKAVSFFNNKIVCDLIEGRNPPGIFRVLDDVCRTVHAADETTMDRKFMDRVVKMKHEHLQLCGEESFEFIVKHYAGEVKYSSERFCSKNKDSLFAGLVLTMQESGSDFIRGLFPENMKGQMASPATSGQKIRDSSSYLLKRLNQTTPHYVRCIKSNDKMAAMSMDTTRVTHQVKYLGLLENLRVRKAGHSYRASHHHFLNRYGILLTKTEEDPLPHDINEVIDWIKAKTDIDVNDEIHMGKSKIFVKSPESIFTLEDLRYKRVDPEGYKLQLKEFKEKEKAARQQLSKGSTWKEMCHMLIQ